MQFSSLATIAAFVLSTAVQAQLSGPVGPLTSTSDKATKVCSVLDYGGVASLTSDIGPPITSAFAACKTGGTVYVPPGDYGMSTWVTLSGGEAWAFQLDGVIHRVGTDGGNMIFIEHSTDFEFFSSTSAGAMQGNGYEFHAKSDTTGPRLLRTYEVSNFSIHDIALVDAPVFHLVVDDCYSGELYNMVIYGAYQGGLDAIDIWGSNIWVHDIEASNKDECVTVKSPAHNILIEDIYCNISGGCAIGSLGVDTDISDILYRNVYTHGSNQMMMIKSWGGSGTVKNLAFENFIGHSNAYSLDFNAYWSSMTEAAGDGISYSNIAFSDWTGTAANGVSRAPIDIVCPAAVPCTDVSVTDFAMWTDAGSSINYICENAYGTGGCLKSSGSASYAAVTSTIATAPAGYSAATMPNDLKSGFPVSKSIPIPTIGTTYFPGKSPASALLGNGAAATVAKSAAKATTTAANDDVVATSTSAKKATTTKKASSTKKTTTKKAKTTTTKKSNNKVAVASASVEEEILTTSAASVTIATTSSAIPTSKQASTLATVVVSSVKVVSVASSSTKAKCSMKASSSVQAVAASESAAAPASTTAASSSSSSGSGAALYGQCGGIGFTGPTTCAVGTCKVSNEYYSQCLN